MISYTVHFETDKPYKSTTMVWCGYDEEGRLRALEWFDLVLPPTHPKFNHTRRIVTQERPNKGLKNLAPAGQGLDYTKWCIDYESKIYIMHP